jgi:NAD(P)-dependent dehydrogenase (short-subunit alcohol dehydrogenase family)
MLARMGVDAMPGTIDDTADEVTRHGGTGIAARCDHTREDEVAAPFARVEREQGRLDILVNNATGHHQDHIAYGPFWELPMSHWEGMFERGVRNHILAARHAAPLFLRQRHGLIVGTSFWDRDRYVGTFFYDLARSTLNRLAFGLAQDFKPFSVTSVAVSPGWMRTELVLAGHTTDEAHWHERPELAGTESVHYVGRAVAALATDPDVFARTGRTLRVGDLAREYGFTDVDGRVVPPFELPES